MAILEHHFDWIIIDSPPVMAVTDASIVAHTASGVIFVVAAEITSRPASMRALQQLEAARANFVGAVLNRVNWKRNRFFYAPYFRREYGEYYGVSASQQLGHRPRVAILSSRISASRRDQPGPSGRRRQIPLLPPDPTPWPLGAVIQAKSTNPGSCDVA